MLQCVECNCYSVAGKGWLAFLAHDPEEDSFAETIVYCPVCAVRELGAVSRVTGYR